jgi:peptide-methionine (R)-S-oxide reductase
MNRRRFVTALAGVFAFSRLASAKDEPKRSDRITLPDAEWEKRLTPEQYRVLRHEGTERAGTSPLNGEKRKGTYACAGCALPLFKSETKYESGTGWPSFYDFIPGSLGTKRDFALILPRTEYLCARCDGHQGHVFDDGPKPTGLRYCNNGVALKFVPSAT